MNFFSFAGKPLLILLILIALARPLAGADKKEYSVSLDTLTAWLGREVDVDYRACDPRGCTPVRRAVLREVTEEAIIVIINGAPFYIPKRMVERVELCK